MLKTDPDFSRRERMYATRSNRLRRTLGADLGGGMTVHFIRIHFVGYQRVLRSSPHAQWESGTHLSTRLWRPRETYREAAGS